MNTKEIKFLETQLASIKELIEDHPGNEYWLFMQESVKRKLIGSLKEECGCQCPACKRIALLEEE